MIICIADQKNQGEDEMSSSLEIKHAARIAENIGLQIVPVDRSILNPTNVVGSGRMLEALEPKVTSNTASSYRNNSSLTKPKVPLESVRTRRNPKRSFLAKFSPNPSIDFLSYVKAWAARQTSD